MKKYYLKLVLKFFVKYILPALAAFIEGDTGVIRSLFL